MSTYFEELPSVAVAIVDANGPAAQSEVKAYSEVGWLERHVRTVLLQDHLSLEESTLHGATVDHFGLYDQDRSVLKEVVDYEFSDSEVLVGVLHNGLNEVGVKDQDL